nr:hypothetical protein [Fredinandcohnia onubensis]
MIKEHIVEGSKDTSFHDFVITTNGMNLIVTNGSYFRRGNKIFSGINDALIQIPSPSQLTHYELWVTETGLVLKERTDTQVFDEVENPIDRLAWFSVPENCTSLEDVEVIFVKVVPSDASDN